MDNDYFKRHSVHGHEGLFTPPLLLSKRFVRRGWVVHRGGCKEVTLFSRGSFPIFRFFAIHSFLFSDLFQLPNRGRSGLLCFVVWGKSRLGAVIVIARKSKNELLVFHNFWSIVKAPFIYSLLQPFDYWDSLRKSESAEAKIPVLK